MAKLSRRLARNEMPTETTVRIARQWKMPAGQPVGLQRVLAGFLITLLAFRLWVHPA
jgi:hypothetical protein